MVDLNTCNIQTTIMQFKIAIVFNIFHHMMVSQTVLSVMHHSADTCHPEGCTVIAETVSLEYQRVKCTAQGQCPRLNTPWCPFCFTTIDVQVQIILFLKLRFQKHEQHTSEQ